MADRRATEALFASARSREGILSEEEILRWLDRRADAHQYAVRRVPLEGLRGWSIDADTGDIRHHTGKFFSVTGLMVDIDCGGRRAWSQPIIIQPEIGILGFLGREIDGVLHLLVQAKMEPGNVNLVQISPSVQATRSNFTQVHGGRRPAFVELFTAGSGRRYLADQLQSEQGARYLRKRNRNVILELSADDEIEAGEGFAWVTIGQLQALTRLPNVIHLDCRSILGGLRFGSSVGRAGSSLDDGTFSGALAASITSNDSITEHSFTEVMGWLTRLKFNCEVRTRRIPLKDVNSWELMDGVIRHREGRYFSVVGVDVSATTREVSRWDQPLIQSVEGGVLGLLVQRRKGVLHFLVQGRIEPGLIDAVELAPTLQYAPRNYHGGPGSELPPFVDVFREAAEEAIRVDTVLSDEGGRFYHSMQRHVVIELDPDEAVGHLPDNFCWMTAAQVQQCAQFSNMVNMELRSLLACLSVSGV